MANIKRELSDNLAKAIFPYDILMAVIASEIIYSGYSKEYIFKMYAFVVAGKEEEYSFFKCMLDCEIQMRIDYFRNL